MTFTKSTLYSSVITTVAMGTATASLAYPDLPVGVKNGAGALVDDTVYVGLGTAGNKFYRLNLTTPNAQWQEIATFPGGERNQPVAGAVNGKLYVFGGAQKNEKGELQLVNDAYEYNPTDNNWTKLMTRSPLPILGASAAVKDGKIYFVGGVNAAIFNGYFQDVVAAGNNKAKTDAITNAYFDLQPQDYFFGQHLSSYEVATNKWSNEGVLPFSGRAGAAFAIQGDELVIVNGEIKPGLRTAKTHLGIFSKNGVTWTNLDDLPAAKGEKVQDGLAGAMGGFTQGGYIITGGANFPGSVQQFNEGKLYAHKGLTKAWHKEVYALDSENKWHQIGELDHGIGYGVALSYQGELLLIGGETDNGKALSSVKTLSYDGKQLIVK